jgi:hypothetical protein
MKSILIIDPDEQYLTKIKHMFEEGIEDAEILTASTFKEAEDYIHRKHFDIITLDEILERVDNCQPFGELPHEAPPTYKKGSDLILSIRKHQDIYCKVVMICKKITEIREGIGQGADIGYRKKDLLLKKFNEKLQLLEVD